MLGIWTIWAWVLVPSVKIQAKALAKRPNQHRVNLDISKLMAVGTGNGLGGFTANCILKDVLECSHRSCRSIDSAPYCSETGFFNSKGFRDFKVLCLGYRFFRHWHHALQTYILRSVIVTQILFFRSI